MTQTIQKLVTFKDFAAWRPEGGRYELHDGVIVEMANTKLLNLELAMPAATPAGNASSCLLSRNLI